MKGNSELLFDTDTPFSEKRDIVWRYQYRHCRPYRRFCDALEITPGAAGGGIDVSKIPIQIFKEARMMSDEFSRAEVEFFSSGTSGMERSVHPVADLSVYQESLVQGWDHFYGDAENAILAYLPGYVQNPNSSLIRMLKELIGRDPSGQSRFLELDKPLDHELLEHIEKAGKRPVLFGAAFGLADLAEKYPCPLPSGSIVLETGGMKTHRKEMGRDELHELLAHGFDLDKSLIHSEYGMSEMLSQAYDPGDGWFRPVPWLRADIHNPDNPLELLDYGEEGLIGINDLANIYSCSFFMTGDRGLKRASDGAFQVLGRHREAPLRGCNFLMEEL